LQPSSQTISLDSIPPFGFIKIPVNFKKPTFLTNQTDTVRIAIGGNVISKKIKITPFVLNLWIILGGTLLVSIIIGLSFTIYETRHLSFLKRKEQDPLRGQSQEPKK
jgi:hypothetical protein